VNNQKKGRKNRRAAWLSKKSFQDRGKKCEIRKVFKKSVFK
jgi:hypothetical protein